VAFASYCSACMGNLSRALVFFSKVFLAVLKMGRKLVLHPAELKQIEFIDLYPYIVWHENSKYFDLAAGKEHYRLLAWLSLALEKNEIIYDIGTYLGFSAMALSYNRTLRVKTYDLTNSIPSHHIGPQDRSNITVHLENILDSDFSKINESPLIFLDTFHDGVFETQFVDALTKIGYKGLLVCDDIHLNPEMKAFWDSISLPKLDVTLVGHWSGTGVVMFDPDTISFSLAN